jgi:hypothetical protein
MTSATEPTPAPSEAPKPKNPEPTSPPMDPEKGGPRTPDEGKSEHPRQ